MVETEQRAALQQELSEHQFASIDSAPPHLSRPLPPSVAPQVLAVFTVTSFLLVALFNLVPAMQALFPERDLYVTRYAGGHTVPLRLFIISFYIAFASAIHTGWLLRLRFFFDLFLPFALFCATFDLCNAIITNLTGTAMPLHGMGIVSGLVGFLLFAICLLQNADMPSHVDGPMHPRFKLVSLLTIVLAVALAATLSALVAQAHLSVVTELRSVALLGGVSVGVFLLIPLLFFLLNILAAVQNIFRSTPSFAPDITIIVPAFNERHAIGAVIASTEAAAARYGGGVTFIVIDNNSTDGTAEAAQAAFAKCEHMRCELLFEPGKGKSRALNRGLAAVRTDYFARLDADTLLDPEALALSFRHFGRPFVGAVGGLALAPGGGPFDGARLIEILLKLGYDQVAFGAADSIFGIPGMFACYNTEAARLVGGFAQGMNGEDTDISLRIGEAGYRLVVDPDATFISEVPRTFAHLREQRHRWFRSIFHVTARNRHLFRVGAPSVRGHIIIPFMLANTARRAMAWPLLLFAINFLALHPDPLSEITIASDLALLLGAPMINAMIAIIVNLRFEALRYIPVYILFRMLRAYLTLESMLSMTFETYARHGRSDHGQISEDALGMTPVKQHAT